MKKHPLCKKKKKVKSGCLTCKSRRVKCDEGRPACKRCVATGRTCEGYGVWGGGGDIYIRPAIHGVKDWNFPIPIGAVSKDERAGFEWFAQRLNRKLSGLFGSTFWDSLIFQACSKEPAVLHAVLALGGAHRSKVLSGDCPANRESDPDSHERFTLRQYNKSISYLQPHFSENSRESVRVALVTCMVFMCLEFIRGQHKRGNAHLQSGLKLLSKAKDSSSPAEPRVVIQKHYHQSIDEHLTEDFMRMYVQSAFLGHLPQNRYIVVQEPEFQAIPSIFQSIKQARQHLDRLRNDIYCLTIQCRQTENAESSLELIHKQQKIQADLSQWLRSYQASQTILVDQVDIRGVLAYGLMRIYQTMASVMVATCLSTADESAYDLYTRDFVSIIDQCIDLWKNASPLVASAISAGRHSPAFNFLADMGLIPLLYYTALKCRVTRVRHQAIRLLSLVPFQEGAWNGTMAARIAREAVEIEEGSFYNTKFMADDFPLLHPLQEEGIVSSALPWLPETYRIHRVEIQLPDYTTKKVAFFCTRRLPDGNYEVLERECDST